MTYTKFVLFIASEVFLIENDKTINDKASCLTDLYLKEHFVKRAGMNVAERKRTFSFSVSYSPFRRFLLRLLKETKADVKRSKIAIDVK